MLKEERQSYILRRISEGFRIYITALSNELGVSDDTLRRDLAELDSQGLLTKVHGGAIAKTTTPHDFSERLSIDMELKRSLAAKVVKLFENRDIILIDGGTSNLEVVRQLPPNKEFTIYTNSFPIAMELMNKPNIEVIFLGGTLFRNSQVTVGISLFQALQYVRVDWLVLGVCSIHPKVGLSSPNREESAVKRAMLERASKTVVIADSHKINTAESYIIGSIGDIDYLAVDEGKTAQVMELFSKFKCTIL
ncbi:MAG: DeoR/GlpR family DNA-binding transcription regulator [Phocaeicola sp.]